MRDWIRYVDQRLKLGDLIQDRKERIVREVAEHLEESYHEARARGASDGEADALARQQVPGWQELASEIRSADSPNVRPRADRCVRTEEAVWVMRLSILTSCAEAGKRPI